MDNIKLEVNATGLNCPLPILRVKKALAGLASGEALKLIATDPGAVKDMQAFCAQTGNPMISSANNGVAFEFVVRKK